MYYKDGKIEGVVIEPIKKHLDERGYLAELFRQDEIPPETYPVMGYISMTYPGITRGPHEHKEQTDYFCFPGPSNFKVVMWDKRESSPTFGNRMTIFTGEDNPLILIIPPGIVHGYKNIGTKPGMVLNFANRLYKGWERKEEVDEIRYEDNPETSFKI